MNDCKFAQTFSGRHFVNDSPAYFLWHAHQADVLTKCSLKKCSCVTNSKFQNEANVLWRIFLALQILLNFKILGVACDMFCKIQWRWNFIQHVCGESSGFLWAKFFSQALCPSAARLGAKLQNTHLERWWDEKCLTVVCGLPPDFFRHVFGWWGLGMERCEWGGEVEMDLYTTYPGFFEI